MKQFFYHFPLLVILFLISGCQNSADVNIAEMVIPKTIDGTGDSLVADDETSVTVTPETSKLWNELTIDLGADFTASNICNGSTIFGRAGTATCGGSSEKVFADLMVSTMYRDPATAQMSLSTETSTSSYASGYRDVPDVFSDDDGYDASSPVIKATRPAITCGTTQATIEARIADCLEKNATTATWDGATKGTSSEGTWKLVTRTATVKEVWRDERTGLLWSDRVGAYSWCSASGNGQNSICNGNTLSVCAEASGLSPAISGENWGTGVYSATKGGMGAVATDFSPSVRWRLPTRNDWLQAEINGIRFVLKSMEDFSFWSASVASFARDNSWAFDGSVGSIYNSTGSNSVRCVGR